MKGLCHLLFGVCHNTARRRKGKSSEVSCIIIDPQKKQHLFETQHIFFVIMLFPLATKGDQAFIRDQL